ncbi:Polygalacturonase [Handroanthus impetiginosus]|uniref:Polygalacturonase n=1 Tax=Handroanthus impetiginosus TaxID=429701 RepID=A0A2G9GNG2_9LAMI|nr:Polygalacturonase [Handroanthus impetiginosus]
MEASSLFFFLFTTSLLLVGTSDQTVFNVLDYGAVGDGQTDDTNAFARAWQETCASSSSATVQVPSGKTFLIRALRFNGPCNSNSVSMEIDGNLMAPSDPSKWDCENNVCDRWIYFHRVDGLTVRGYGTIDGRGDKWWHGDALEISSSNNIYLGGGLNFKDSPRMHVVLNGLRSLVVSDITIDAPEKSPNTDGIHVTGCTNAFINHSRIGTGDDCISIVDGSSFVTITNIICGPGHGISIGSLGKNGANDEVEYISVSDVVFIGSTNGARIKTWQVNYATIR